MGKMEDPFETPVVEQTADEFSVLSSRPIGSPQPHIAALSGGAATGRLHGFDLEDHPLVSGLAQLPGEVVAARTTVPLLRQMMGESVVVLYEQGDPYRPIIVGVLQKRAPQLETAEKPQQFSIQADDDRHVVTAEREIVLRCGDASITLTRAGKVIIKGNYIISRSTGYNKIKGAAIDIN
jgi:hypothetical protein